MVFFLPNATETKKKSTKYIVNCILAKINGIILFHDNTIAIVFSMEKFQADFRFRTQKIMIHTEGRGFTFAGMLTSFYGAI